MQSRTVLNVLQTVPYSVRGFKKLSGRIPLNALIYTRQPTVLSQHVPQSCLVVRFSSTNNVVPPQITKALENAATSGDTSTNTSVDSLVSSIGPIPDIPAPPPPPVVELLPNGEPSLVSLGLDGYWPSSWFQKALEFVHVSLDVPWWGSIVIVTVAVRLILFPVVVKQLRANVRFSNHMPQFMVLQQKMSDARAQNDQLSVARYGMEMTEYMKDKNISPLTPMKYGLIPAFVLMSFTIGLRGMCNLPVESMKTGGFHPFMDLTISDPTYILAGTTAVLVFTNVKLGVDMPRMMSSSPIMKHVIQYGIPSAVFFSCMWLHSAVAMYWTATAAVALIQSQIIKRPKIRAALNIEKEMSPEVREKLMAMTEKIKVKQRSPRGFIQGFRESMDNSRIANEVKNRAHIDELAFERAGREPIRKTFKYNPKSEASKK